MFGLSFAKVLLLVLVVAVVWFGFRWLTQMTANTPRNQAPARRDHAAARESSRESSRAIEDLAPCPRCSAYVSAQEPTACSRADCPYPRAQ
jgi:uncharacterized protein